MSRGRHAAPTNTARNARIGVAGFAVLATMVSTAPSAQAHPEDEEDVVPAPVAPDQEEAPPAPVVEAVPPPPLTVQYVVVPGDSLSRIAVDSLALPAWEQFYAQNVEVIGPNPHVIFPGQALTYDPAVTEPIPAIPEFAPPAPPAEVVVNASEQVKVVPEQVVEQAEAATPSFGTAPIINSSGPVQIHVQEAADAVFANVRGASLITIGGTRSSARDPNGHPSGRALDYMVLGDAGLGDSITQYHIDNWEALGVDYIIWQQRILSSPDGAWQWMADRGSGTQNHYDHVHVNYR
jgi:LysM repeat protein